MEVKDNSAKDNESFEILTALDSFLDKPKNSEMMISLAHPSHEAINVISSSLAQSITEETISTVIDLGENFTDAECRTNTDNNSDGDFIKIRPLQQDGISIQADDEFIKVMNSDDFEIVGNSPSKDISREEDPETENEKPYNLSDSISKPLSNMCHEKPEVKKGIESSKTFDKEMADVNDLPTSYKSLTKKKGFSDKLIYPSVLITSGSEDVKRFKAQQNISAKKIYSFDSLEIVQMTSLKGEDLNEDSVDECINNAEDSLPEVHENFNEERFAVNTVLNGLGKDFKKRRPFQARAGRELKTTSSTIAFRRNSSGGICEAMFNNVPFCGWIKKTNLVKRIVDAVKAPIEFLLNIFEDQINCIIESPRKVTVIEYLEVGGALISEAVTKGLRKKMGYCKFETAYYGSREQIFFHPLVGEEAGEEEARKQIQMVRASEAVEQEGIIVATVMVLFEDAEDGLHMATLLYLEDPTKPRITYRALTSSEPVATQDGKVETSCYLRHSRLKAITEAAEFLGRLYGLLNAPSSGAIA